MPTTFHNSDQAVESGSNRPMQLAAFMRHGLLAVGFAMLLCVGGCAAAMQPAEFFELAAESPANRAMQSRYFETGDEKELLSASAAVFQDLGFQVEEIVREVGMLRVAKERSAREHGQDIARFLVTTLTFGYVYIPLDLHQKITAVLTVRPINTVSMRYEVRVAFYRVVWKGDGYFERNQFPPGEQRMEMIRSPEIYQKFFTKLSKAVFLEAFTL